MCSSLANDCCPCIVPKLGEYSARPPVQNYRDSPLDGNSRFLSLRIECDYILPSFILQVQSFSFFTCITKRGEGRSCLVFVPIFGNDCNSKEETLKKATLKSQDETYQLNSLFLQNRLNTCKNSRLLYLCTGHGFCKVRRYTHQYLKQKEESFYP